MDADGSRCPISLHRKLKSAGNIPGEGKKFGMLDFYAQKSRRTHKGEEKDLLGERSKWEQKKSC